MVKIDELLNIAKRQGASDMHITVGISPKIRVNGELCSMDFPSLSPEDIKFMLGEILTDRYRMVLEEKGEAEFSFSITSIGRFRANVFRQRGSYAVALRIVADKLPDIEQSGIPRNVIEFYKKKRGLILVTGPAGSGKSTTLAAIVDQINEHRNVHIITLEDPIEFLHPHKQAIVNQREIGLDSLSYAGALKAALREDPDVIQIGEMGEPETIRLALHAAENGRLVLGSLHTIGAIATINRLLDVFPPHQQQQIRVQLSGVLEAVISQQLIPTIDRKNRAAAFEVLPCTSDIRAQIREGKTNLFYAEHVPEKKDGKKTMDESIYELYIKGFIEKEEALAYAQDVEMLGKKLI